MSNHPQIFAHRGAKSVAPENTLPAFQAALDMGVDGIELDVHSSRDGQLVVIHNFDVDETTNGAGPVSSFTVAELGRLDAGSHFGSEFAGVGVPTLEEVLDLVGDRCRVNIEIKSMDLQGGGDQVEPLLEVIRQRNLYEQVIVSSFNPVSLIKTRWLDDGIALGLLHEPGQPLFQRHAWCSAIIGPEALHPHYTGIDGDYIAWAESRNLAVNTWTVNDVEEARRLADLGADAIISDVPDQLIAAFSP